MRLVTCLFLTLLSHTAAAQELSPQRFARLGDIPLSSGAVLHDAALGYRTYGELNAAHDNAIVAPTWFTGKSDDWQVFVGPDKTLDFPGAFIVVIDALANGISSSPSHLGRRAADFPEISIRDMVEASQRLLTEHLGIAHVQSVIGISMAGMQALQWAKTYPDYMDSVVSIVGTPRVLATDITPWRREVEDDAQNGDEDKEQTSRDPLNEGEGADPSNEGEGVDPFGRPHVRGVDRRAQLRAMLGHDIAPGEPLARFAGRFPRALFLVDDRDSLLSPAPSLELATALGAASVRSSSWCGHLGPMVCDTKHTRQLLRAFLLGS